MKKPFKKKKKKYVVWNPNLTAYVKSDGSLTQNEDEAARVDIEVTDKEVKIKKKGAIK